MAISWQLAPGRAGEEHFPAVAALQAEVFRAFPHLCAWDASEYERLLRVHALCCEHSLAVIARDGDRVVGASTARSLGKSIGGEDDIVRAFRARGFAPEAVFYCADSVLLPDYRGQGLGVEFFRRREDYAREAGFRWLSFCAVRRSLDDPRRPASFTPLDGFWRRRGFQPVSGLEVAFQWPDVGAAEPTSKAMQFWVKALR